MSSKVPLISNVNSLQSMQKAAAASSIQQEASTNSLQNYCDTDIFNPMAMTRRFLPLASATKQSAKTEKTETEEQKIIPIAEIEEAAARFQKKNDEMQIKTLLILRSRISAKDTAEEILKKVIETYQDYALADEAFEFLLETADFDIKNTIQEARNLFASRFEREIKSGRNIGAQAREFSKEGLGSPTKLREMYSDITGAQREPLKLFEELSQKFTYENLKTAIRFLLHALGADLKSKGPSISRAELKRLLDETRSLQGILGIYRFFQGRMQMIIRQFLANSLFLPPSMTFESIAKLFVKFLAERFISPEKILQTARLLGISESALAQVILYAQMCDAIKQIAPRYYRNNQHRDELLNAFFKVLEDLEDRIEKEKEKRNK